MWNTNDPSFATIIKSPAYLQFVLETTISSNFTLKVPFALLNLTLTPPIVAAPRQYFPCEPYDIATDSGNFHQLGRAFLQAVVLGQNFNSQKMFLAQSQGPGAAPGNLVALAPTATSFTGQPSADFGLSWSHIWTPLPMNSNVSTSQPSGDASNASDGLSTGAKAGIGVGVTLGALGILAGGLSILWMKRKKARGLQDRNDPQYQLPTALYSSHIEAKPNLSETQTHELPNGHARLTEELSALNSPQELPSTE